MNSQLQRVKIWFTLGGPLQRAGIWLAVLIVIVFLWRILLNFPK